MPRKINVPSLTFKNIWEKAKEKYLKKYKSENQDNVTVYIRALVEDIGKIIEPSESTTTKAIGYQLLYKANLSFRRGEKIQLSNRVLNSLTIYISSLEYLDYCNSNDLATGLETESANRYFSTAWNLFDYYTNEDSSTGIARNCLSINPSGKVTLYNISTKTGTDEYVGTCELYLNCYLVFSLSDINNIDKKLHLKVYIGYSKPPPISIGIYSNVFPDGSIASGTILFQKLNTLENCNPKKLISNSDEIKSIEPAIREFFNLPHYNLLKVPKDVISLSKLNKWNQEQKRIKASGNKTIDIEYDVFLSAPMAAYENENDYKVSRKLSLSVVDAFKNHCELNNIYYAGNNIESTDEFNDHKFSLERSLNSFRKSKTFVFIYPEKIASSVFVEAGWAIYSDKPSIFFVKSSAKLPFLLKKVDQFGSNIRIVEFKNEKNLISIIKNNGAQLFEEILGFKNNLDSNK